LRSKIRLEGTFEPEQRVCGAKRNEQPQAEPAGPSAASQSLPPVCGVARRAKTYPPFLKGLGA
jgi:hypothetical protein